MCARVKLIPNVQVFMEMERARNSQGKLVGEEKRWRTCTVNYQGHLYRLIYEDSVGLGSGLKNRPTEEKSKVRKHIYPVMGFLTKLTLPWSGDSILIALTSGGYTR